MKIRRNDFSNLRQLRGSSCWSALDETRHAPREFHSFNRAIRRQPSFFARDRAIWKRGKISPDTLHRAPTTFHLVNPFHRSFVYFSSRVFLVSFLFFFHFSTPFQRSSREKLYFVTGHERYYNKRANVFFTQFHSTLSFSHYWTLGKLKLKNFTNLYYTCWKRTVTLLQGTGKIHHFDSNFELDVISSR